MTKQHTVLIVEDHEINREILCEILKDKYNILTAEDGQQCLDVLRKHLTEIDVILLDILMPVMDGYEVLNTVRHDPLLRDVPIMVITSNDEKAEELHCLQLGANDFIHKPYDPTLMYLRIGNIIHLSESTKANRLKTTFINNVNHEIRTPLNAIMGFSQLLGMPANVLPDDEREKYVQYIINNSKMLLWMIEDMLFLSETDNNSLHIEPSNVLVNNVCHAAMNTMELSFPQGVRVYFTTDIPNTFSIHTDGNRAQQILTNLLSNACKWTTEGEIHLHCSATEQPGHLTISVTDTGIGIPATHADYVFEPFAKIDTFKPGNGLGLTIARSVAKHLGAQLSLDTTYTDGARFTLTFQIK